MFRIIYAFMNFIRAVLGPLIQLVSRQGTDLNEVVEGSMLTEGPEKDLYPFLESSQT